MYYSKLLACDTNNGNGFRVTLFVSGCTLNCPHCHNKEAQNFKYGQIYTNETKQKIIELMGKKYISGFSLLGGEAMDNLNSGELLELLKTIKETYPEKTIYCWTGYSFEKLLNNKLAIELMKYIDMLRDGEFILEQKDLSQYLQGSKNQRYVDCKKSLSSCKFVEYKFIK